MRCERCTLGGNPLKDGNRLGWGCDVMGGILWDDDPRAVQAANRCPHFRWDGLRRVVRG